MVALIEPGGAGVNAPRRQQSLSRAAREAFALMPKIDDPAELRAVIERAQACLNLLDAGRSARAVPVDWLYGGIVEELRSRGVLARSEYVPVVDAKYRARLRQGSERLEGLCGGRQLAAHERAALGRVAGECLAAYVEARRLPVCLRTMLQHAGDVVAAVDDSYPGYAGSGMLLGAVLGGRAGR